MQIRPGLFPIFDRKGFNKLIRTCNIGGNAKQRVRCARFQNSVQQLIISKWCFHEKLSLLPLPGLSFQALYRLFPLRFVNWQVAPECKRLPAHTRSHQRQQYRRGAYKRHHTYADLVCKMDCHSTRVCNTRATCLRNDAGVHGEAAQVLYCLRLRGVFVKLNKGNIVDQLSQLETADKPSCSPDIFYKKNIEILDYIADLGTQDFISGVFRKDSGNQV